jgi:8-oxo-dGTP pyrophosphatase MutT (NUDIX family)
MFFVNARAIIERQTDAGVEIILQVRAKPNERPSLELPGGRLELYEPILDALRREVLEETGLTVTHIEGEETRIDTDGINPNSTVECVKPFCVYQTVKGAIDSTGAYFRCRAEGELLERGDGSEHIRWVSVQTVRQMMDSDPLQFMNVDRAGLIYYLKHCNK